MKIKAEIVDLDQKYYGTIIKLTNSSDRTAYIEVWINDLSDDYMPSEREIDFVGEDGKPYIILEDGEVEEVYTSDNHYETQTAYEICKKIVEALNDAEV